LVCPSQLKPVLIKHRESLMEKWKREERESMGLL
jgi:hypothetical protein